MQLRRRQKFLTVALASMCATACVSDGGPSAAGKPVVYQDVRSSGMVSGVGVESQDIVSVTDEMVRDILSSPEVVQMSRSPRIVIDSEYFYNDSGQRLDKNLIVSRLKANLQRASKGRLLFVSRESAGMVSQERELKRTGVTDSGTTGLTKAQAGVDYRLVGRISSQDARSQSTGAVQRYTTISFELIDTESSISVWTDLYEFSKAGMDDAVYR